MVSATQTQPPLRWLLYVCPYIPSEKTLLHTDDYIPSINSDICNRVKPSILSLLPPQLMKLKHFAWAFLLSQKKSGRQGLTDSRICITKK